MKKFEGRVYKVKGFVVDPLNKTRTELYKEEGSDNPAPPTGLQGLPPGMMMQGSGPK